MLLVIFNGGRQARRGCGTGVRAIQKSAFYIATGEADENVTIICICRTRVRANSRLRNHHGDKTCKRVVCDSRQNVSAVIWLIRFNPAFEYVSVIKTVFDRDGGWALFYMNEK
jgi:hypothetical protein